MGVESGAASNAEEGSRPLSCSIWLHLAVFCAYYLLHRVSFSRSGEVLRFL